RLSVMNAANKAAQYFLVALCESIRLRDGAIAIIPQRKQPQVINSG
ncbi:MAG: hypothetical protein QG577_2810, partial [Thermodesulfobacteriota bacterium]|nr:hypothetical protein [Thermodesulfobacteriota bacterium]